jgi:hypothetical protein
MTDDFERVGFLGQTAKAQVRNIRADNASVFSLSDDLSGYMMRLACTATGQIAGSFRDKNVIASALLCRSVEIYQGVVVLAERGLVLNARILTRALLENAFAIAAIHANSEAFIKVLEADNQAAHRGQVKAVLDSGIVTPNNAKLREIFEKAPKGKFAQPSDVSAMGVIESQYIQYRRLSNDSCHPSVTALRRHVNFNPGAVAGTIEIEFAVGSKTYVETAQTLHEAFMCAVPVVLAFLEITEIAENGLVRPGEVMDFVNRHDAILAAEMAKQA